MTRLKRSWPIAVATIAVLAATAWAGRRLQPRSGNADWGTYGGQPADMHFSSLRQINRANVARLQRAWSVNFHEAGGLETSPIEIGGVVYVNTPEQQVVALDGATGKQLWEFDSRLAMPGVNRGMTYWAGADGAQRRIFASVNHFVYALDSATGKPIPSFGDNGRIDLRDGLGRPPGQQAVALDTPGVIYKNLLIVGGRVSETLPASPGDIRAFNVLTGKLAWDFHSLPHPGDPGYTTWPKDAWKTVGGANNWAGMAVDTDRGIVYVPTGSAAFDFYGGNRIGANHFADSLLALDAATGKMLWFFQGVHHDLWDRDFPSPPTLVTLDRNGQAVPAVAQTTKQGVVYVFNRLTGAPLFPIMEKPFPSSSTPGEQAWPTQPWPTRPAPFARQLLSAAQLTDRTPAVHAWALKQFTKFSSHGQFVPLSVGQPTVVFPGFDGGAEWGGSAYDPATHLLFINSNDVAWTGALAKVAAGGTATGRSLYLTNCAVCHQDNLTGVPPEFPSLVGIGQRLTPAAITKQIRQGGGRMPPFPTLTPAQVDLLVGYLRDPNAATPRPLPGVGNRDVTAPASARAVALPYRFTVSDPRNAGQAWSGRLAWRCFHRSGSHSGRSAAGTDGRLSSNWVR